MIIGTNDGSFSTSNDELLLKSDRSYTKTDGFFAENGGFCRIVAILDLEIRRR